ncbi:DMT family transporter [Ornithinibacillus xuwenensis]|uniref:DMT family transporter n=1 Tax=Ornithinibacillus xuwenensis TaxID=3144668 RepID=A0ABU9XKU0_9BACI
MSDQQKGHFYNLLSVLAMAIGPLISKFGLLHVSPAIAAILNVVTILMASYLVGVFSRKGITFYFEKEILMLAIFNSLGVIFMFISMNLLSPVEVGFLGRFYTVFAVLLSVVILKERLSKLEVLFITLAILGAFLFVEKGNGHSANGFGALFAVLYTFFFALTNIYIKKTLSEHKSSNSILFTNNCITLCFVVGYAFLSGELANGLTSLEGIGYIMIASLLTGFLGTILLYQALKYLRFSIANVTRAFSPVILAILSYPFFPIKITIKNSIGAVVLVGSIILLTVKPKAESGTRRARNKTGD